MGFERIAPPAGKLRRHIVAPIRTFEFETIDKACAKAFTQRAKPWRQRSRHSIEVGLHRGLAEVVEYRTARTRRTSDHRLEARKLHEKIKHVFTLGDVDDNRLIS